jgi:hypothetical protein
MINVGDYVRIKDGSNADGDEGFVISINDGLLTVKAQSFYFWPVRASEVETVYNES